MGASVARVVFCPSRAVSARAVSAFCCHIAWLLVTDQGSGPDGDARSRLVRGGQIRMEFLGYRELGVWDDPSNDGEHRIAKLYQGPGAN